MHNGSILVRNNQPYTLTVAKRGHERGRDDLTNWSDYERDPELNVRNSENRT